MWWNIFIVVFGCIVAFIVGAIALVCHLERNTSTGNEKKAWKRAFEGWVILFLYIMLDIITDILKWIFN